MVLIKKYIDNLVMSAKKLKQFLAIYVYASERPCSTLLEMVLVIMLLLRVLKILALEVDEFC